MSRIIDADALINAIDPMYISKVNIVADTFAEGCMQFEKLIREQPTAYDIDKVVEQPEHASCYIEDGNGHAGHLIFTDEAIEIVRGGGTDD